MAFGNGNNGGDKSTAINKFAFKFRKGQKEDKPHFLVEQFAGEGAGKEIPSASEIKGELKGVFYNISDKEEYSDKLKLILQDGDDAYYLEFSMNSIVIPLINSLLGVELGTEIRVATFTNKAGYKNLAVFNPNEKAEITTNDGKKITVDKSYRWVYKKEDIVDENKKQIEVIVTKNKSGKVVDVDDAELNDFFRQKINEVFGKKEEIDDEITPENIPF